MSRDIFSPDDETVYTGRTTTFRRYQTKQGEQVNSRDRINPDQPNRSLLKKLFSEKERQQFLDREREELTEKERFHETRVPEKIIREIRALNETKQPLGFWTQYAKKHKISSNTLYNIRYGHAYKEVK